MDEQLIQGQAKDMMDLAERFRSMADKMDTNAGGAFGGAFVVIPPLGGGDPFETLVLDSEQDPVLFYQLLQSRITTILNKLDTTSRQGQAFRR